MKKFLNTVLVLITILILSSCSKKANLNLQTITGTYVQQSYSISTNYRGVMVFNEDGTVWWQNFRGFDDAIYTYTFDVNKQQVCLYSPNGRLWDRFCVRQLDGQIFFDVENGDIIGDEDDNDRYCKK